MKEEKKFKTPNLKFKIKMKKKGTHLQKVNGVDD